MAKATMRAAQIERAGGDFKVVEKPVPEPGTGQVRIKVEACGICHSDLFVKEAVWPGLELPRVPGHEVVGVIDELGAGVTPWRRGDRVGVGWHGGHCFTCSRCRRGDFITCENRAVTGISYDGGYAEYMVAPQEALARVPEELGSSEAAPLLCAGITTYNALRHTGARPGDLVAVLGIGGLGHLGVQFAHTMGFRTVAISHGNAKRDLALELGADDYIDASRDDPAQRLEAAGGARVILATAPSSDAISGVVDGLGPDGELVVVGVDQEPIRVTPLALVGHRRSIRGWPSGDAMASQDTLEFSALTGVRPTIERFELGDVNEAYERMITNQARFRVVLEMR